MDTLKNLKEAAQNRELAVILGSQWTQEDIWNRLVKEIFSCIVQTDDSLKDFIERIQSRGITTETFFRILYQKIGEKIFPLLKVFELQSPHSIHDKIAALIKSKSISWLGVSCIDNGLSLALKKAGANEKENYSTESTENSEIPVIAWLNGEITNIEPLKNVLSLDENKFMDIQKHAKDFFKVMDKAKAILVIGFMPGDFCWRAIYGRLLSYAKQNKPIYWLVDKDVLAIDHLLNLCNGFKIQESSDKFLTSFLKELNQEVPESGQCCNLQIQLSPEYFKESQESKEWHYLTAIFLNYVMDRYHASKLFEQLTEHYLRQKNYKMLGHCYRNQGQILFEQGYLERSIESHIKAIDYWAMERDEENMAQEYVFCGDDYLSGSAGEKAVQHYGEALSFYRHLNNTKGVAEVTAKLALICDADEDYELARRYYLESVKSRQVMHDIDGELITLFNLSNCLIKNQEWEKAKAYIEDGITLCGKQQSSNLLPELYQLLGLFYMNAQDYKRAREYYEKVYELYVCESDNISSTFVYFNLANLCARLEDYDAAIQYYDNAIEIYQKMGDWSHLGMVYSNLGLLYSNREEYDVAEEYFVRAEEIFAALRDASNLIKIHTHLAKIYTVKGEIENAVECYHANMEMLLELGAKEDIASTLIALAMVYLQNKDIKLSMDYLKKAIDLYDALGLQEEKKETLQILNTIETKTSIS